MAGETLLEHPVIGSIRGVQHSQDVQQYLGIQYAELTNGFARGTVKEAYTTPLQATALGPLPIGNLHGCYNEHLLLQHTLPHAQFSQSDTQCLTLNVSTPSPEIVSREKSPLPVLVFVHGGGFVTGSGNWPQWDTAKIVQLSIQAGQPIVAVGINYRIGLFGFLTSAAMRKSGYLPNNGLHDQKLAFRWIQKYISGFGGDPQNVTFLGSSIGAASGFIHLQSQEALFSRLVALGGSGLIRPVPLEAEENTYKILIAALGLGFLQPWAQVAELVRLAGTWDGRIKLAGLTAAANAVIDDDIVRAAPSFSTFYDPTELQKTFPGTKWCKDIFMSDARVDGMVFAVTALPFRIDNLAATLESCLQAAFGADAPVVSEILSAYGINKFRPEYPPIVRFLNDIGFRLPAQASAEGWATLPEGQRAYLGHFDSPNPWPGLWQGHASHALDIAFALQNYNQYLGSGQQEVAEQLGRDIVTFAHGVPPFERLGAKRVARLYYAEPEDEKARIRDETNGERPVPVVSLEKIVGDKVGGLDQLLGVLGSFLKGPA